VRSANEVEGEETRSSRRSNREGGEGGGASIAGGRPEAERRGWRGERRCVCLPAAVSYSCVQCVFKHVTSVRPRKACNAAQRSAAFSLPHTRHKEREAARQRRDGSGIGSGSGSGR
jgi:hypothetical protein